jgi:hypothetical protein
VGADGPTTEREDDFILNQYMSKDDTKELKLYDIQIVGQTLNDLQEFRFKIKINQV